MKKQSSQVAVLVLLLVFWAIIWHFFISAHAPPPPPPPKAEVAKVSQSESLLKARFRRVRGEMDALYHFRIKPTPFDAHSNPFRIPGAEAAPVKAAAKLPVKDGAPSGIPSPDFAESLLKSAVSTIRIGGVVALHGTIQLTLGGQLHREGDVITGYIQISKTDFKPIRLRIRHLSEEAVTFALEDPETGSAQYTVHLKEERH